MDDLDKLEILGLVSQLTTEIGNVTGVTDKTMAEFVLELYEQSKSFDEFNESLDSMGAGFPKEFVLKIDGLIKRLHPKFRYGSNTSGDSSTVATESLGGKNFSGESKKTNTYGDGMSIEEKEKRFGGLALPDQDIGLRDNYSHSRPDDNEGYESRTNRSTRRERSQSPDRKSFERLDYSRSDRNGRGRGRGWEPSEERYSGPLDPEPVLDKVYDGTVGNLASFGAFVRLNGVKGRTDGLVHISALAPKYLEHPNEVVQVGDSVKVKVMRIEDNSRGKKYSLSMKDVDQITGESIVQALPSTGTNSFISPATGANSFIRGGDEPERGRSNGNISSRSKPKKRLTSPERWEIRQLVASGAVSAADYPDLDEDFNAFNDNGDLDLEEDVDIEVKDDEPPFLSGQTKQSLDLNPVRIIKAPDGTLNRAAMNGAVLARERRELKMQQAREKQKSARGVENANRADPLLDSVSEAEKSRVLVASAQASAEFHKEAQNAPKGMRRVDMSIKDQRESLPVFAFRNRFLKAMEDNQILIVVGETGSGKTTQLTQYLAEAGYSRGGIIGCTQPRRVAAMSVAERVAQEVGCRVGDEVGYSVRFDDNTSRNTRIKYMTDGMLQREALLDPNMSNYNVIMLDEAHERTIATDVLFALLKKAATKRPDLKLIITSATLDASKFSDYFLGCPIFQIPGKTFEVEVLHTKEPEPDYLDSSLMTVMQIHLSEPSGDILVFLTGQEEIDTSCEVLYERMKALGPDVPELIILPMYSSLPNEMQSRIFDPAPPGSRKVIFATNIAETSITIDGIYYVVDPGFVKVNAWDPKLGLDKLVITPISKAQANQRKGRAGRTGPGKCYRLYTEAAYENEMEESPVPEIQRQNIANTILLLKAMGINDLLHFDFMDKPPVNTMLNAMEELYALAALDDEGLLTRLGRKMADFPMDPSLSKVLIASVEAGCGQEMLTIVAMLTVPTIFYRPKEKQELADQKRAKFFDPNGDHLTNLTVYEAWKRNGSSKTWCSDNFIQERSMRRVEDVRKQLTQIMVKHGHKLGSCGPNTDIIRKVLCSGLFRNAARRDPQEGYKTLIEQTPVYMHPSSSLFGKNADYVIYHTLLLTSKEYMHCVTSIDPKWLVETAPTFYRVANSDKLSKRKQKEKIMPLFDKFAADQNGWRLSSLKRPKGSSKTFG